MIKSIAKWFHKQNEIDIESIISRFSTYPHIDTSDFVLHELILIYDRRSSLKEYVTLSDYFWKWLKGNTHLEDFRRDGEEWYSITRRMDDDHAFQWLPKYWDDRMTFDFEDCTRKVTIYSPHYLVLSKISNKFNPIYEENKLYYFQTCLLKCSGEEDRVNNEHIHNLAKELVEDGYVYIKCRDRGLITCEHCYMVSIKALAETFGKFRMTVDKDKSYTEFFCDAYNCFDLVIDYLYKNYKEQIIKIPRRKSLGLDRLEEHSIEFISESLKNEYEFLLMKNVDETIGYVWKCDKHLGIKIADCPEFKKKEEPKKEFPDIRY